VKPKIYSWSHLGLENLFNLAAYDSFPNRQSSSAGFILAEHVVMPLVCDNFKSLPDGSCTGDKISMEEAAKRLRNLTLFGYSAGSIVAQETFNASVKLMKAVGYEEKEARKMMKEVVLVAMGCISRPSKEIDRYTTVTLAASNDRINRFKNWIWGSVGTLRRSFTTGYLKDKNKKTLQVRPLSASYTFVSAAARRELYESKVDPRTGEREQTPFRPLYPAWTGRHSYHEPVHYTTTDDDYNGFSRIALYATANAINRTASPDSLKLLDPPAGDIFNSEAQAAYRQRVRDALKPMPPSLAKARRTS
jgi:hypothetical protein